MDTDFCHSFPAARGMQAGRPCYVAMCPMRLIPKIFVFDEEEVPAELRAQRTLNRTRIPEIVEYLVNNPTGYTISAITASIDGKVTFQPSADTGPGSNLGVLSVPMDVRILINDGQHRRAAIEQAIAESPELSYDNIPVLFFIDEGLTHSQQMFADLNKHAVRPSDSISTLYDHRDAISELARSMIKRVEIFSKLTEMEKSSISNRSTKLFTLSAIKNSTKALLLKGKGDGVDEEEKDLAAAYWNEVTLHVADWQLALDKKVATSELREQYVHAHGVMLQAMGQIGADLLVKPRNQWAGILKGLKDIDWARANPDWEGRAMHHGRISKARSSVVRTGNYIKHKLGLPLTPSEQAYEEGETI
ncbi:DNA sulfur modification protein DndB [Marinobacter antarcticus]|uniref:DNA sulfur modification protein DndB n=1 Tax=Marinobacter antarcticus TaxID=564117 RepID=A0A1M6U885_9GAMM|nr:DNA sulfur modification protein DndB [Marinobacter antarcticus]SHK65278.1 DNA sulfur modification protein DndB [Marinobacter antarcticus]